MYSKVIASAKNWIESNAIDQLESIARLPGMRMAIGMPDLHPGKDAPIGAVFASENIVYPHLIGNDIGCGMTLWQTDLGGGKPKLDKWAKRLSNLEGSWEGDTRQFLQQAGIDPTPHDKSLGTIGGGNHFAELQRLTKICDQENTFNIDDQFVYLLVHSGSRGFGEQILQAHQAKHGNGGLVAGSKECDEYVTAHDHAVAWARANRKLIALRMLEALGTTATQILDICHNFVQPGTVDSANCWLHRKGAAPSDQGQTVIPGSRGSLSYLVTAAGHQLSNLATVAHGAGRKWKRSDCRERLRTKFSEESLLQTKFGSKIICDDKGLLYEEAPQAYKDIDIVVGDLLEARLIKVVAIFAPLITYKTMGRHKV